MVVIGIGVTVMAVTMVILACFMIPAFIEIRKTAIASRQFLSCIETDLKPVLKNLDASLADLKTITAEAADKIEDVGLLMHELGNTGRTIRSVNSIFSGATGFLNRTSLWATGAKVAGKLLIERIKQKRG